LVILAGVGMNLAAYSKTPGRRKKPVTSDADMLAKYGGAGLTDDGSYIGLGEIEDATETYEEYLERTSLPTVNVTG